MPVIKLATEGQFDLRNHRYHDRLWWTALRLALQKVDREMLYEVAKTNMSSAMAHSLLLVVQSLVSPQAVAKDFVTRQKVFLSLLDTALRTSHAAILGQDLQVTKQEDKSAPDIAASRWESVFGKRGDPKVEAAIEQTHRILQGMMDAAEAVKARKTAPKPKRPRKFRRS